PLPPLASEGGGEPLWGWRFRRPPPRFVAARFAAKLEAVGVTVVGTPRKGVAPANAAPIATVWSPSLAALVRHMNTASDNYYPETLVKALGAAYGAGGTPPRGAAVVRTFAGEQGFSARVVDGSGLSRGNAVSPSAIGRLLVTALGKPWFDALYRSL